MKKLISISLVLVLSGGLILAENNRAEAIDPASAALIATSFVFLPVIAAISSHEHEHEHYRPAANYYGADDDGPYRARVSVYHSGPRHERYYDRSRNSGYGYERDYRRHRGDHEDRRVRDYGHKHYAGRHHHDND